jgi:hypothetical protein
MQMVKDCGVQDKTALLLLVELSQQAAIIGEMGNEYTKRYLHKGEYREPLKTGLQWVKRCIGRPRYLYKMFRMSTEVFMALHELLISTYGLKSTKNVSSIESLAIFLWIIGGPQPFSQAENYFTRSTWTVHTSFMKYFIFCAN